MSVAEFLHNIPFDLLLIQTVNGIVTGLILALVASGLTLIFGIMDVVNFAHGELFMMGAYLGAGVLATTGNFWLALIVATLLIAILGGALQILYITSAAITVAALLVIGAGVYGEAITPSKLAGLSCALGGIWLLSRPST